MASRMERYFKNESDNCRRTHKNADLYRDIYVDKEYDNVNTSSLDSGKLINLDDLRELIKKADDNSNGIIKEKEIKNEKNLPEIEEEKIYDIQELMSQAKKSQPVEEKKPRSLAETQVFTLQELVNSKDYSHKEKINKEEMKDLINTIYNTNMLNNDEGDGLLDCLKSTGNTVVSPSIKKVLDEAKKEEINDNTKDDIDKSFYTSSLGFKQSDFDNGDILDEDDRGNKFTTWFLIVLGLLFAASVVFVIVKYGMI